MQIKFKNSDTRVMASMVDTIVSGMPDATIDIHIERSDVTINARRSGYALATRSIQQKFEAHFREDGLFVGLEGCSCKMCSGPTGTARKKWREDQTEIYNHYWGL